jgi:hypothetical protein
MATPECIIFGGSATYPTSRELQEASLITGGNISLIQTYAPIEAIEICSIPSTSAYGQVDRT